MHKCTATEITLPNVGNENLCLSNKTQEAVNLVYAEFAAHCGLCRKDPRRPYYYIESGTIILRPREPNYKALKVFNA